MSAATKYRIGDGVRRNRVLFRILDRDGDTILAEQIEGTRDGRCKPHAHGSFEVWKVRTLQKPKQTPSGCTLPKGTEVLPSDSDWGTRGWTYSGYPKPDQARLAARRRFVGATKPHTSFDKT